MNYKPIIFPVLGSKPAVYRRTKARKLVPLLPDACHRCASAPSCRDAGKYHGCPNPKQYKAIKAR